MLRKWYLGPVLVLVAAPALAQDDSATVDEGFSLLREGARILMESMLKEMEPALRELGGMIGDLRNYHPPEKLPNGDIIIRRKTPAEILTDRGEDIEL